MPNLTDIIEKLQAAASVMCTQCLIDDRRRGTAELWAKAVERLDGPLRSAHGTP